MPDRTPHRGLNLDEVTKPPASYTARDLERIALNCEEREGGLTFGPGFAPVIVQALRALARERSRR